MTLSDLIARSARPAYELLRPTLEQRDRFVCALRSDGIAVIVLRTDVDDLELSLACAVHEAVEQQYDDRGLLVVV